ncbi:hypothetical protein, conserved [Eimeria maxima]|uniref:Protein kinase domain-containing protein n=1 Tax=Eimeria maxima TaxID=5804 RepID=U6M5Y5_EIMMA|nr:hypothetical protein, conserved [Eimeria maxima]CDJ59617.1 hypothetical protein, conserved [Eimeria maxima]
MIGQPRPEEGQATLVPPSSMDKSIQAEDPAEENAYTTTVNTGTKQRRKWERYFLYFLTLGVASALLFTLDSTVPETASRRLPLYKDSGVSRGAYLSVTSPVMPSSSRVELEQQQPAPQAQADPGESDEGTPPSSSGGTVPPSRPEDQLLVTDMWGLPMLDQFERTLPLDAKRGKEEIAAFLAKGPLTDDLVSSEELDELSTVARILSKGSSDSLVGITILLANVKPLHWGEKVGHLPRLVHINEVIGKGYSAIVVEVEDTDTHDVFAMRIIRQPAEAAQWFQQDESFIAEIQQELTLEEEGARQLCGVIPASMVASKKGVAVPLYSADIAGAPEAQRVGDHFIFSRVQLMERCSGAFIDLYIRAEKVVEKARDYIARRLLQIILKFQQAGLSHNDLKWDNMLLRPDGTLLIADLGSALPFGSPCRQLTFFTPQYREPQLALQQDPGAYESGFTIPQASSDLWSLGILLYELFTNEVQPYGEVEGNSVEDKAMLLAEWLIENQTRSASLEPSLEAANVPDRWMQLILRLLEPSRSHRITAWGIVEEFPDLVHNPQ